MELSTEEEEENEESDMRNLTSIFDTLSTVFTKYSEQEDQLNQKVKEAASTLHSQNETVNCLFNDLVVSMEYPF